MAVQVSKGALWCTMFVSYYMHEQVQRQSSPAKAKSELRWMDLFQNKLKTYFVKQKQMQDHARICSEQLQRCRLISIGMRSQSMYDSNDLM